MIKKLWQRIAFLTAGVFVAASAMLLLGSGGPVSTVLGGPQVAQAEPVNGKFYNVGDHSIAMCRWWTTAYGDGRNSRGTCKKYSDGGTQCALYPDRNTYDNCFWSDAQGFYVRTAMNIATRPINGIYWVRFNDTGWWRKRAYVYRYSIKQYYQ